MCSCCAIAMCFFLTSIFLYRHKILFLGAFFFAFTFIFASNPTWTFVILNTASPLVRPMALGVATIFYHLCGDVPSPMIVGRFLDYLLAKAGDDKQKRYYAYVYCHWFSALMSIVMVIVCILTVLFAKQRLNKERREKEGLLENDSNNNVN